ncbi:hypothetical protein B6N60_05207 [Richelia sinica FACHB-800]|uniref:Uncharacterized protein n=1 Tax=Richelia sinica FACHB-800 TaxID=1357546 RepID=A0A975Y7M3_9NOST|nr:hypothetical protein [Richelia sinica]MBD2663819.1 hypothetical protein [Richelia sinica FACHB-800]QXE26474.1 hypothetical protein B6N60_05207 [Richelia sinica FACHB-800]
MENKNFAFRCYFKLKNNLGRFDAIVECNELAIRELTAIGNQSLSQEEYIKNLSEKHGVKVDIIELDIFRVRISQWYILSVYQQAEEFIREFISEHPRSSEWTQKSDKESQLQYLLTRLNITPYDLDETGKGIRCEIFEYYRLIRNTFMHSSSKEDKKVLNLLKKINENKASVVEQYRVEAPNEYSKLGFDDFILFSRVTKDIAQELCRLAKPSPSEIAQILIARDEEKEINLKSFKKFSNNVERQRKFMKNLLKSQYNLQEEDVDPIIQELKGKGLLD